jgi:hypothetical protein
MPEVEPEQLASVAEYFDSVAANGGSVDQLETAMFVELEFNVVVPDYYITSGRLTNLDSTTDLVRLLLSDRIDR